MMTRRIPALVLPVMAVAVLTLHGRATADAKKHGPISWQTSMAKAKAIAAKQKKPMFVDFYAEWCPPCREMLATTYKDKAVVERAKRFVPVLIDTDKDDATARSNRVEGLPTVVFFDSRGRELLRAEGYRGPRDFLRLMEEAEKKARR